MSTLWPDFGTERNNHSTLIFVTTELSANPLFEGWLAETIRQCSELGLAIEIRVSPGAYRRTAELVACRYLDIGEVGTHRRVILPLCDEMSLIRQLGCETIVFDPLVDKTGYSGKWLEQIPLVSSTKELGSALHVPAPCLLYTSPSPRDRTRSRMPSSA